MVTHVPLPSPPPLLTSFSSQKERFEKLRSEMYSLSHELSQKSVTIENLQLRVKEAENAVAKASTAQPNRRFIERIEERHSLELAAKNQRIFELEQQLERTQLKCEFGGGGVVAMLFSLSSFHSCGATRTPPK